MGSGSPVLGQSSRGAVELPEQLGLWDPCPTLGACGDTAPLGPASLPPPAPGSHILPPCNHAAQLSGAGIWLHACSGVCYLPACLIHGAGRRLAAGPPLLPQPLGFQSPTVPKWVPLATPAPAAFTPRPRLGSGAGAEHGGLTPLRDIPAGLQPGAPGVVCHIRSSEQLF